MGAKHTFYMISLLLLTACNNSEHYIPVDENNLSIQLNLLNYTNEEFEKGTLVYLVAVIKDSCIPIDSITINKLIPSKANSENGNYSKTAIPSNVDDDINIDLWNIHLEDLKKISKNGAILIKFPEENCELLCNKFTLDTPSNNQALNLDYNITLYEYAYYSIDLPITRSNLQASKQINTN